MIQLNTIILPGFKILTILSDKYVFSCYSIPPFSRKQKTNNEQGRKRILHFIRNRPVFYVGTKFKISFKSMLLLIRDSIIKRTAANKFAEDGSWRDLAFLFAVPEIIQEFYQTPDSRILRVFLGDCGQERICVFLQDRDFVDKRSIK